MDVHTPSSGGSGTPPPPVVGEADVVRELRATLRRASLLEVPHGFTTRLTGTMRSVADRASAAGLPRLLVARQVHGRNVLVLRGDEAPEVLATREADALVLAPQTLSVSTGDAMVSSTGVAIGVLTADCVPLLLWDPPTGVVGAVHAGWRGLHAGVIQSAVTAMEKLGAAAGAIRVAIGASIGPCCFEVGSEVADAFAEAYPDARDAIGSHPRSSKPHIDLRRLALVALGRVGVAASRVDGAPPCTRCAPDDAFFSFRREGTGCGLQLGFIQAGRPVGAPLRQAADR